MSTKFKLILFTVIVCIIVIIAIISKGGYEKQNETIATTEEQLVEETTQEETTQEETTIKIIEEYTAVWTIEDTIIKKEPDANSETVGVYSWNTNVIVTCIDDNWAKVKDTGHYINRLFISEDSIKFVDYDVPKNNTIKSYMDYRYISAKASNQYKLQKSLGHTGNYGVRMVGDRYCVAVGSYYTTTIGQYIDIELENGYVIKGILADCKDDAHTDSTNRINPNGSVVEFVVDTNALDYTAKIMGDISYVDNWNSKIVNIRVYDFVEEY